MSVKLGESTHSTVQINNLCEKSTLYSYVEVDCTKYLKVHVMTTIILRNTLNYRVLSLD